MSFCTKKNQPVTDDFCLACFTANEYRNHRLRMSCVAEHITIDPADVLHAEPAEQTPGTQLTQAAEAARNYLYHNSGHTAESRAIVRQLDQALAAVRELEVV